MPCVWYCKPQTRLKEDTAPEKIMQKFRTALYYLHANSYFLRINFFYIDWEMKQEFHIWNPLMRITFILFNTKEFVGSKYNYYLACESINALMSHFMSSSAHGSANRRGIHWVHWSASWECVLYINLCPQEQEGVWFCVQASICTHHTGPARPPRTVRRTAWDGQSCRVHNGTCYDSPFSWCRATEIPHHAPVAVLLISVHHASHMLQCCQLYRLHRVTWGIL